MAQMTSLVNTSLCCDMKVVRKPDKLEEKQIAKARKDLERFGEKNISFGSSSSKPSYK
jgi:hypothetical protein